MGWPDSGYLWRDNAEPAQEQYANIAKAISEFEPLTMFANAGAVRFQNPDLILRPDQPVNTLPAMFAHPTDMLSRLLCRDMLCMLRVHT